MFYFHELFRSRSIRVQLSGLRHDWVEHPCLQQLEHVLWGPVDVSGGSEERRKVGTTVTRPFLSLRSRRCQQDRLDTSPTSFCVENESLPQVVACTKQRSNMISTSRWSVEFRRSFRSENCSANGTKTLINMCMNYPPGGERKHVVPGTVNSLPCCESIFFSLLQ